MKTKHEPLLSSVLLCAWLLFSPQETYSQPVPLRLEADYSSNQLTLRWQGALGVKLQQATNLTNLNWLDVLGSDGLSSIQLPMTNPLAAFRLVDLRTPDDGDGLDDSFETNGWTIFIDAHGYGTDGLVERNVTSDPGLADTDGDGLTDFEEWIFGTDPRADDTDHDGLSDYDEIFRYHTSPTSVDTDGDARGPNHDLPPKAMLFDGNELRLLHTSPTLEDTDGDGRTDYEEYDQLGRNPLVAEVPRLGVELVDAVDIRLDVEYAEEVGTSHEYGGELSISDATRNLYSTSSSLSWQVTVGAEVELGLSPSASVSTEVSVGGEVTVGFEHETTKTVESSQSDYLTDSRTRTETAASGSMSGGIRLMNTGPVTYTITDLGMTVRYMQPGAGAGGKPSFQTLATLIPTLGANGFTLAPGDSTPVLQVEATGLNASRVKQFMARPNSLYLEPAFYELENAGGLNFDFLEEVTRWRTARVQIDYGNGTNEEYRVATNVERNEDGSYAGVTLGNVLSNILHMPFQTVPRRNLQTNSPTTERVLYSVRDTTTITATNGFWSVAWSGEGPAQDHPNFDDIALHAGDQVLVVFVRDNDGDGLFTAEEQHYRTDNTTTNDFDGDGLRDVFEARTGWDVVLPTRTYHVYSDPAQADQDGDGLTDLEESQKGTDPARADTDDDGIPDGLDQYPLAPARVLRVKADAAAGGNSPTNGTTWDTALTNLQDALSFARAGLASTTNSADDVGEIWVAAGVYKPTTSTSDRAARFELVNNTAVYGGFAGGETKQSQRNADPLFNGTILSGDLQTNDASFYSEDPGTFSENSYHVCYAANDVGSGTILDGFMITGGNTLGASANDGNFGGGGMLCQGYPQLKNLAFRANNSVLAGGGLALHAAAGGELKVSDCLFLQNQAIFGGGLGCDSSVPTCRITLTNCQFVENRGRDGGAINDGGSSIMGGDKRTLSIEACAFRLNVATNAGGGVYVYQNSAARISRCQFDENTGDNGGGIATGLGNTAVEVVQSVFLKNTAVNGAGGAINIGSQNATVSLYVLNSTFHTNWALGNGDAICGFINGYATVVIENSIFWGNDGSHNQLDFGSGTYRTRSRVRSSCLQASEANLYPAAGNISADPKFVDGDNGNLRLQSGSPCIDHGNNFMDYYPRTPGLQLLPATDLDGNRRIVDGNSDGTATVDMGAYERQGQ